MQTLTVRLLTDCVCNNLVSTEVSAFQILWKDMHPPAEFHPVHRPHGETDSDFFDVLHLTAIGCYLLNIILQKF